ncbi:MAG: BACON domain-containing protein [Alloprevotella sp.]
MKLSILPVFLTALSCLGLITSCGTEQEEFHTLQTGFADGRNFAYADEVEAGFVVISTDSWELTRDAGWVTLNYNRQDMDKVQVTVPAGYMRRDTVVIKMQPNATPDTLKCTISCQSAMSGGFAQRLFFHLPHLNISNPTLRKYPVEGYYCVADIPASGLEVDETVPYIEFTPYAEDATLSSDADWIVPSATSDFESGKTVRIPLTIGKNTTGELRRGVVRVTSNGITTSVLFRQEAEEQE